MAIPWRLLRGGPDAVSPTAHYTGHVWTRNDLSHPRLATFEGWVLFGGLAPLMALSRALGGATLEGLLLARHRVIDDLLTRAIEDGGVSQVIEPACGMSARGWRFSERYGDELTYVEADLPGMAERKRRSLAQIGSLSDRHRVAELDVLRDDGPGSLAALAATLDPDRGLAIVTEGLTTYLDQDQLISCWRRLARALGGFSAGRYLSDLRLGTRDRDLSEAAFAVALSIFVRARVHRHFDAEAEAVAALRDCGFARARLHRCDEHPAARDAREDPGAARLQIVEAELP